MPTTVTSLTTTSIKNSLNSIGIFGGTFDPIHFGHLRSALEIYELLSLDEMRLIPTKHPPHRAIPFAHAEHRFNMVRLAVEDSPLTVDDRELHREGLSYSVDTLMSLRREHPKASICMVVGVDAFLGLTTWFQWEKLIQLANIVVMHRSGWVLPKEGPIAALLEKHALASENLNTLSHIPYGAIMTQAISALEISASHIRNLIQQHRSPSFLLPEKVYHYIQQHKLYGYDANELILQQEMIHV